MNPQNFLLKFYAPVLLVAFCGLCGAVKGQAVGPPLTNEEFVRLVYQIPKHPEIRDEIVDDLRKRGIAFPLTDGLKSIVATKSGNDSLLRQTLEEANRRRLNPVASALPPVAEARDLLAKTTVVTLAAADAMPDFIVRQQIARFVAYGSTKNWIPTDRLTIAVSYRAGSGEEYKVLAVNGLPPGTELKEGNNYEQIGGTTSSGEYVSMLSALFSDKSRASFNPVDTDTLRGRRTIVYEFEVQQPFSHQSIKAENGREIITGYRGRIWVDRELFRVLKIEDISTEIPADFPVRAASRIIDYDWVTINDHNYLLPSRAVLEGTVRTGSQTFQSRNDIKFRGYQKFGAEVRILDDVDDDEAPKKKP